MNTYMVRFWVDVKIDAETEPEAREIARKLPIAVAQDVGIEEYDTQVADVHVYDTEISV